MDEHTLRSVPLFASLGRHELRRVAQVADTVDVSEGKELLHQGAFAYEFMVIEDGHAEVTRDGEHVADLGPGEFLGEIAALESGTRNASVIARSPMSLIVMTAHDLRQLAASIPELGQSSSTRHRPSSAAGYRPRWPMSATGGGRMAYRPLGVDLTGRVALITGANSGMGKETARELARMGAQVILGCRSAQGAEEARSEIVESTGRSAVSVLSVDLASPASVRAAAAGFHERFPKLDVLVNNAAASLRSREVTQEGFERHWATNVLGPHLLTTLLLPALAAGGRGRIVTVSTVAAGGLDLSDTQYEKRPFSGIGAYRASKQASRMLTWALADRLADTPVTANALNPGYVLTDLTRNAGSTALKFLIALTAWRAQTPLDGADTAIWLAASPDVQRCDRAVLRQAPGAAMPLSRPCPDRPAMGTGRGAARGRWRDRPQASRWRDSRCSVTSFVTSSRASDAPG